MKKWQVTDIRWANFDDLSLPFWQKWRQNNPLPDGFWQRIWEYPYAALHVPSQGSVIDIGGTYPFVLFPNWPNAVSVDKRNLNKVNHPLLKGQFPKGKLLISPAEHIKKPDNSYDYAISISAIEEMDNTVAVLKEMIRLARHRVVVTMDVSEKLGVDRILTRELEDFLGVKLPPIPHQVLRSNDPRLRELGQPVAPEFKHIRVLGIVIDSLDTPQSVGVLIPHWESYPFAEACIKAINRQSNRRVQPHIYLLDDHSSDGSYERLKKQFGKLRNISFLQFKRPDLATNADVGRLIDLGLNHVKEQFVAMIDADTIPLSPDWLTFPIWLLQKYHASSVGLDTGLSSAYSHTGPSSDLWWQPDQGYSIRGGLYDNEFFTVTNNLYRVMRTSTAQVVSNYIGFTRGQLPTSSLTGKVIKQLKIKLNLYEEPVDPRSPYLPVGCDNGVAANHFIDINRLGPKFNLPLTSYIGLTDRDGAYGQNISGLLFHFALSTRALSNTRREIQKTGTGYMRWVNKIQKTGHIDSKTESEMIKKSFVFKTGGV